MKIPCYVIVWHDAEMTRKCLWNLKRHDGLDIRVIHSPSENSFWVNQAIHETLAYPQKVWKPDENRPTRSFLSAMTLLSFDPPEYVICTDGDLEIERIFATVEAQIDILKRHPDVLCVGPRIRLHNLPLKTFPESEDWVPQFRDAGDYLIGPGPHHFLMFRGMDVRFMTNWMSRESRTWQDTHIDEYGGIVGKRFAILKDHWHRHLAWDAYANNSHPYTQARLKRSFEETWK